MLLTKSSAVLLAGATLVAAEFRPVENRKAVVPGSFYLRLANQAQADAAKAVDPRVKVFPSMNGGSVSGLAVTIDPAKGTISGKDAKVVADLVSKVLYVEEDVWMYSPGFFSDQPTSIESLNALGTGNMAAENYNAANWALKSLAGNNPYPGFGSNGEGVDVYVIGHGINVNHTQFEGRAKHLYAPANVTSDDETGVSTLEAGIIAAKDYGVAPKANILSVKVPIHSNGATPATAYYEAGNAIIQNAKKSNRPAVVYTGLVSKADTGSATNIFRYLVNNGGVHASATGASWSDSCRHLGGGLSYGADYFISGAAFPNGKVVNKDKGDEAMSPYGGCAHLTAPGFNLKSTSADGKTTKFLTGQNAAAAVTAGLVAGFRSAYPAYTQSEVKAAILSGVANVDADITEGGMLFSRNSPRVFDLKEACRSYSPVIPDNFCRAAGCPADYKTMCEINAKSKPSKVCKSIVSNIPDAWCAATGCPEEYSKICQWQCNA